MPETRHVRLTVAQTATPHDPRDGAQLRSAGRGIRQLMRAAREQDARLIHFPEGATCSPHKRIMSGDPGKAGQADWGRFDWNVLRQELAETAELARTLRIWTVLGSVHPLTPPHRPHNSLYVISDRGEVVTRYDERMLSNTKITYMYSPGSAPITFEVDGIRFGCALGIECHFPEIFLEYERLDVDCVLFSTHGPGIAVNNGPLALQAQAHAVSNSYWVSYAGTAQDAVNAPSGMISPDGEWAARCPQSVTPALAVADLVADPQSLARPWRRLARRGMYDRHLISGDPRSEDRRVF